MDKSLLDGLFSLQRKHTTRGWLAQVSYKTDSTRPALDSLNAGSIDKDLIIPITSSFIQISLEQL